MKKIKRIEEISLRYPLDHIENNETLGYLVNFLKVCIQTTKNPKESVPQEDLVLAFI